MSALEQRGNGFCLTGPARWCSVFGSPKLLVGERGDGHDLMETIRERFNLRGDEPLGQMRITVELIDDEKTQRSYEGPI